MIHRTKVVAETDIKKGNTGGGGGLLARGPLGA